MDEIREEFETQAINMGHSILKIDGQYIESLTIILHTGYLMGQQSRDEEIAELKGCNAVLGDYIDMSLVNSSDLQEEINKLKAIEKDAVRMDKNITKLQDIILSRDEEITDRKLECIDYQETIIKQQAEIKKLRDEKTELKDAYAETFEKYIPENKLSEVNEFLLSRFKDYGASIAMVDRKEALKEIT